MSLEDFICVFAGSFNHFFVFFVKTSKKERRDIWDLFVGLGRRHKVGLLTQGKPAQADKNNPRAEAAIAWVQAFILGIRKIRGEMDIAPGKRLDVFLANASEQDRDLLEAHRDLLQFVGRVDAITLLDDEHDAPESAVALVEELKIMIPLAGLIDKEAELGRLTREIEKARASLSRTQGKLGNPNFTDKAPAAVVEKEREKLAQGEKLIENLSTQLEKIQAL